MKVRCASCRKSFEASRSTAKFCSPTCRQRARRGTAARTSKASAKKAATKRAAADTTEADSAAATGGAGLVAAVKDELERLDKLDTFDGQLALQLATRVADPEASSVAATVRVLREAMNVIRGSTGVQAGGGGAPAEPTEPDDEVTRARRAREEARQAAGRT